MLWYSKLGGRKFLIAIVSLIGILAGIYLGKVADVQGGLVIIAILGLYGYSNNKHHETENNLNNYSDGK